MGYYPDSSKKVFWKSVFTKILLFLACVCLVSTIHFHHRAQAASTDPQFSAKANEVIVLSECIVSYYEAIRFALVSTHSRPNSPLASHAGQFLKLLSRFERDIAKVAELSVSTSTVINPTVFASLNQAYGALIRMSAALKNEDSSGLFESLIDARAGLLFLKSELQHNTQLSRDLRHLTDEIVSSNFNELTHIAIDGNKVSFFGKSNPDGPANRIPYEQIWAQAIRLPAEGVTSGQPPKITPGFSLEPAAELLALNDQMNSAKLIAAQQDQFETIRQAVGNDIEYVMGQALNEIRESLRLFLFSRTSRRKANAIADGIVNMADLSRALEKLLEDRILTPEDGPNLDFLIQNAILKYQATPENIIHFPLRPLTTATGKTAYAEPKFYGVDQDTQFARIMLESDVALKGIVGSPGHVLKKTIPHHQTYNEWVLKRLSPEEMAIRREGFLGIEIRPERISLSVSVDDRIVAIEDAKIKLRVFGENGLTLLPAETAYEEFLTGNFDAYAREIDSLWEVRELLKLVAAARYLEKAGIKSKMPMLHDWAPPEKIEAQWNVATIGIDGKNFMLVRNWTGGVSLHVQQQTQVETLKVVAAEALSDAFGHASGQPIEASPDPVARIQAMPADQLASLKGQLSDDISALETKIDAIKQQELKLQMKGASPLESRAWGDVAQEWIVALPGASLMADLGQAAANDMDSSTSGRGQAGKSLKRIEAQYQKFTDDKIQAQEILNIVTQLGGGATGPHRLMESVLVVSRESLQTYRDMKKASSMREATLKALPHASKIMEELPKNVATFFPASQSTGSIASSAASAKGNAYLAVGKLAIDLIYEAVNISIVNAAMNDEKKANQLLLNIVTQNRMSLENTRSKNIRLIEQISKKEETSK